MIWYCNYTKKWKRRQAVLSISFSFFFALVEKTLSFFFALVEKMFSFFFALVQKKAKEEIFKKRRMN